jgi:hypothetical protein
LKVAPVATRDPIHVSVTAMSAPTMRVTRSRDVRSEFSEAKPEMPKCGDSLLGVAETWIRFARIVTGATMTSTMRKSVHALRR